MPPAQEGGYNIQALVDNSNAIIEFIRGISMVRDETMEDMLGQLLQLNLIASQILHLNSIGHPFGYVCPSVGRAWPTCSRRGCTRCRR